MNRITGLSRLIVQLLSMLCIVLLVSMGNTVHGEVIIEFTFDDAIPLEWDFTHGEVEVQEGELVVTDCVSPGEELDFCYNSMWLDSTAIVGSWSLDYYRNSTTQSDFFFYFMSEGVSTAGFGEATGSWPPRAYCVFILDSRYNDVFSGPEIQFGYFPRDNAGCQGYSNLHYRLSEDWHNIHVTRNNDGEMKLYIDYSLVTTITDTQFNTSEHTNIQVSLGDRIDNFTYSNSIDMPVNPNPTEPVEEDPERTNREPIYLLGALASVLGIGMTSRYYYKRKGLVRALNKIRSREIIDQTLSDFDMTNMSLMALISRQGRKKENFSLRYDDHIPPELLKHRYLMHPIRLATMKLLYTNDKMKTADVRQHLGIVWGEFGVHVKSLEDRNFIEVKDGFDEDGTVAQTLYITQEGRKQYQNLYKILHQFIEKHSPIEELLGDDDFKFGDADLYPKK